MQLFHLDESQYIIHLRKKYSWEAFKKVAKVVPGTYSEIFTRGVYSSVFEGSINLTQEYYKYYKDEYENIYQFIFWRYGVSQEIYQQIPNPTDGFLTIFKTEWQMEDDEILKETFVSIFTELDQ